MFSKNFLQKRSSDRVICNVCGRDIPKYQFYRHIGSKQCVRTKEYDKSLYNDNIITLDINSFKCGVCERLFETKHGLISHISQKHDLKNINKPKTVSAIKRVAWNKGLNKSTSDIIFKASIKGSRSLREGYRTGRIKKKKISEEHKLKLSIKQSLHNTGGRSKWYTVAGQKVQCSWERNIALKFEELGIDWQKVKSPWKIFWKGKERRYTPDFYLPKLDLYLEIKGFWWRDDREKMNIVLEQHKHKRIVIVEKVEYEKILSGDISCLSNSALV